MTADPAVVIATARSWLGTPYHDQASLRGVGCDCLGLARGVWREVVGDEPFPIPPYSRGWGETGPCEVLANGARQMMPEITPAEAGPGALVLFRMAPRAIAKHVGILGVLAADFFAGPVSRFDLGNALVVDLYSGTLESVTDITLLGGANALAVETGAGQWEVVQAGAAELIAPGRYRLIRLLRGQRGTEWAMVAMVPTGARVVVLDPAVASLPVAEADLGLPWNWRIGPASKPVSDETFVATTFIPEGAGLRPFSVAHVDQPWRIARSPGDLTIRWTRRSRSLAADTWGAGDVPLAEDSEAYAVDIMDGSVVKRSLTTATTSALYTAAQQTADWGAPLGPGQSLSIRIFQLSALIGRGAGRSVTLTF